MNLTILYDNEVYKKGIGLKSDWGFACLVEIKDDTVLFDCGAKGDILLNNMHKLDVSPEKITKIVISHEHWDHNGGLRTILPYLNVSDIYRLERKRMNNRIKQKIVDEPQIISEEIFTTGRLPGSPVDEQSLLLKSDMGWFVLVGCSHSGVENILYAARQIGNVVGIIGGLHDFDNFSLLENLEFISPCHCTKYKREIQQAFPTKYVPGGVGKTIDFTEEFTS